MWEALHSFFSNVRGRLQRDEPIPPDRPARKENDSSTAPRITLVALVVGDQDRKLLAEISARNQWSVHFTDTCGEAWVVLNQLKAPVILCDRDLPGREWRDVMQMMASSAHSACAILLSRVVDDYLWNEVIGKGGYDVLAKPLREDDVVRSVRLAWSYWNSTTKMSQMPLKHYR
jgi:DNA-binding NtrC family response regulator